IFFLILRLPPTSPLFPYTTLFRSIDADQLFSLDGLPLPKHLLEQPYNDDKASLSSLPYWSSGFVGTGPFKVKEWVIGSSRMILRSEEHTSELQSLAYLVCRLLLEK